jgi:prepilin-type N-terminal cleavage/methylation domain-containing protein
MNKTKGFTIIELIVVIAIIAVLATIVLVNVTSYINKGKDAAAKGDLAGLLTYGAIYADTISSDYSAFCDASGTATYIDALEAKGYSMTGGCTDATSAWCAIVTLKAVANDYCVDSSGNKMEAASASLGCASGVCQ